MFQHYKLKIYDDQLQDVNELITFLDKVPDDVEMIQLRVQEGACIYQCGAWNIVLASVKLDRIHFLKQVLEDRISASTKTQTETCDQQSTS